MLIAFSGKKKTGKDTAADLLVSASPKLTFQRLNFADGVYEEIAEGIWPSCICVPEALQAKIKFMKENKDNFRLILQGWGTDFRRKMFGEDYWVKKYANRLKIIPDRTVVMTTDVRFVNEAEYIKSIGGVLIRISRDTGYYDTHVSETELDNYPFDIAISNNGTKDDLLHEISVALKQHNHSL